MTTAQGNADESVGFLTSIAVYDQGKALVVIGSVVRFFFCVFAKIAAVDIDTPATVGNEAFGHDRKFPVRLSARGHSRSDEA